MSKDDFPIGATPPRARIALEEKLGHVFARPELLDLALTHSSWANEYSGGQHHNERQEFLGDAVLELCVSWELFRRFPEAREGELTKLRARLVSTVSLAERAREFGLDSLLKLGKGEERQGGQPRFRTQRRAGGGACRRVRGWRFYRRAGGGGPHLRAALAASGRGTAEEGL